MEKDSSSNKFCSVQFYFVCFIFYIFCYLYDKNYVESSFAIILSCFNLIFVIYSINM